MVVAMGATAVAVAVRRAVWAAEMAKVRWVVSMAESMADEADWVGQSAEEVKGVGSVDTAALAVTAAVATAAVPAAVVVQSVVAMVA